MAGPKHNELPAVVVPQHLWLRSARPAHGKVLQFLLPALLVVVAFTQSGLSLRVGFILLGVLFFILIPILSLSRLEQLGRQVLAADRKRAAELLRSLPERPIVRFFAPRGWTALQMAQLHLKVGDGQAAAAAFAEAARLCLQPDAVMLVSAQAHAYVLAGDRLKARELLQKLTDAKLLGPRDQLDLGIVLLIETKKFKQALSYIETARKTIGDHPRVLAAQALALQKIERIDEASELFEQVQIAIKDQDVDPVTDDLVKRARKGLQDYLEAQLRRERRARSRRTTIVVSSEAAASEIVSGEISGGAESAAGGAPPAEPETSRRFQQVEAVDPEPTPPPSKPDRAPAQREPDAPQPGLEIDLYSVPRSSAHPLPTPAKKEEPRADSVFAALSDVAEPKPAPARPDPAAKIEASARVDAPGSSAAKTEPAKTEPAKAEPVTEDLVKTESDVPTFRRRQTLQGTLPTEPNKPAAPNLPSLSGGATPGAPKTGLPTRATRHDGNPLPAVSTTPPTTVAPTFRAPTTRGPDKGG